MQRSVIIRRLLPVTFRQELKHHWRQLQDIRQGTRFDNSYGDVTTSAATQPLLQIVQPIRHSSIYANKIINITRGAALLNKSRIRPHHNWSFWHRLHRPDAANGFVAGRNLVNGKLVAQTGGGLCQLSSMAYHLALTAGLTVIERHAHSIDIYEEYDRYTPLGADATVVWGVKDLRLFNPYPFAVSFSFAVQDGELVGEIQGKHPLTPQQVEFIREPLEDPFIKVETHINQQLQTTTIYEQQQGLKAVSASAS